MKRTVASLSLILAVAPALGQPAAPIAPPMASTSSALTQAWASPQVRAEALCRVDALLGAFDRTAAPQTKCAPGFSLSNLPGIIASDPTPLTLSEFGTDVGMLYQARAFAAGSAQICGALDPLQHAVEMRTKASETSSGTTWAEWCRERYQTMSLFRGIVARTPALYQLCVDKFKGPRAASVSGDAEKMCRALASNPRNAASFCDYDPMVAANASRLPRCRAEMSALVEGDAKKCSAIDAGNKREDCLGLAAFGRAYPAKDSALCAKNETCLLLFGEGARVAARYERRVIADIAPALLVGAQATLKKLDIATDPQDSKAVREIDDREERIAVQLLQVEPAGQRSSSRPVRKRAGAEQGGQKE